MDPNKYLFFGTIFFLLNFTTVGFAQNITFNIPKYVLVGQYAKIQCTTNVSLDELATIAILYRNTSTDYSFALMVDFFQNDAHIAGGLHQTQIYSFKDKISTYSNELGKVTLNFTKINCMQSNNYKCTPYKQNFRRTDSPIKVMYAVDNTGDITLNVKGQGKQCPGTEGQCCACNNLKDIQGYAKVGEDLNVACTKKMPFPYKMGTVNTFKWYYLQPTGNGNFQETEITRNFNTRPTFSKDKSTTPPSAPTPLENCQRVENTTSSAIYVPKKDSDQVITLKCRIELKVGSVKDSKEKKINICILGDWSPWKPSSKCTKSCTRSMRRECGVGECQGKSEKTESCTGDLCNTDKWSDWTPWSKCAKTCTRSRRRECLARECSDESKKQESCTGDLCIKNVELDKEKDSSSVVPIVVGVVAAIIVAVSAVALWMKFRKKSTNEQTNAKPEPVITDTTTQYASDYYTDYNDPSKVTTNKEETTPTKDPGSQKQPKTAKEDPKDNKKKKKTKNVNENGDRSEDYYDNSDEKVSRQTKQSETKKSKIQK